MMHTYYPAGGAVRVDGTLSYVLGDQLGSASTVLDSAGNKTAETRYYPFGQTRFDGEHADRPPVHGSASDARFGHLPFRGKIL